MKSVFLLGLALVVLALPAAAAKPDATAKPVTASKTPVAAKKTPGALQRADFRVTGASCVACLRRVAKRLREAPGVLKADVSIFRPYWGLVIYDKKKTTLKKVLDGAVEDKVQFAEVTDVAMAEMPIILLPKTK